MRGSLRFAQKGTKLPNVAIVGIIAAIAATSIYLLAEDAAEFQENNFVPSQNVLRGTIDSTVTSLEHFWQDPTDIFSIVKAYGDTQTQYDEEKKAAQEAYNNAIIEAKIAYEQVLFDENATSEEKSEAKQAYTLALIDAKEAYYAIIAEIKTKYEHDQSNQSQYYTIGEARNAFLDAISQAKIEYEQALSDATTEEEIASAEQEYNQAILDARYEYEKAKAELER